MTKLQVVVGGQAGSEGKGAIAAHLASKHEDGMAVRVAGPNAGHTVIGLCPPGCTESRIHDSESWKDPQGHPVPAGLHRLDQHPWRLRQVPVAAVSNRQSVLCIAAGSEVDPNVLLGEIKDLDVAGYRVSSRLWVDPTATVIDHSHYQAERDANLVKSIGSTGKGIGAARADRAMRSATLAHEWASTFNCPFRCSTPVADLASAHLAYGGEVLIEGTQGYLLGQHAGHYPKCTSSDCTAIDFLSMAGLSPWLVQPEDLEIWVVFRPYPIRVAGDSGPLNFETTWENLGLPVELTTVTRKPRRVGLWDPRAARAAMYANGFSEHRRGPVRVALTMADQMVPTCSGLTSLEGIDQPTADAIGRLVSTKSHDLGQLVSLLGTGPATVVDLRAPASIPVIASI